VRPGCQPCLWHEHGTHLRQWVRLEEKKRLVSRPFVAVAPHSRRGGTEKMKRRKKRELPWPPSRRPGQAAPPCGQGIDLTSGSEWSWAGKTPARGVARRKLSPPPSELCSLCASSESASGREKSLFFVLLLLAGSPLCPLRVKARPLAGLTLWVWTEEGTLLVGICQ